MNHRAAGVFLVVLASAAGAVAYKNAQEPNTEPTAAVSEDNCPENPPDQVLPDEQLDACIQAALKVMEAEGIPGSFDGIKRNIIRESGGNPQVINDWDENYWNGTPSKGLLQVIEPTFDAHKLPQSAYDNAGVRADANDQTDPVANIVTACAYAWSRYPGKGGIDGINSAY